MMPEVYCHIEPNKENPMPYILTIFVTCSLLLSACETKESPDPAQDTSETETEVDDREPVGSSATSCGAESQGLEPVDCTMHGDVNAYCVYSNHCACSTDDGFQCEEPLMDDWAECAPGSSCIPIE